MSVSGSKMFSPWSFWTGNKELFTEHRPNPIQSFITKPLVPCRKPSGLALIRSPCAANATAGHSLLGFPGDPTSCCSLQTLAVVLKFVWTTKNWVCLTPKTFRASTCSCIVKKNTYGYFNVITLKFISTSSVNYQDLDEVFSATIIFLSAWKALSSKDLHQHLYQPKVCASDISTFYCFIEKV